MLVLQHAATAILARCIIVATLLLPHFGDAAVPSVADVDIKAALTYKLAKYVDWPPQAFHSDAAAFVICVVGNEALVNAFRRFENKPLHNRTVSVRRASGDTLDLRRCHLVYFANSEHPDLRYTLETLSGASVLTVGETREFVAQRGMVALLTNDDTVRFTINLLASKDADLTISSQLLQLASVVGGK
jgi:hypothetical protein